MNTEEDEKGTSIGRMEVGEIKELEDEEVYAAVRKMKLKKAAGIDGIPMEVWCACSDAVKRGFLDLIKRICMKIV